MITSVKRILITPGEPAGIGPDITIAAACKDWPHQLIAIADPDLLKERAKKLNVSLTLTEINWDTEPKAHTPNTLAIVPVKLKQPVIISQLNEANAAYVIETLKLAASFCLSNKAQALVTGPVHKGIINAAHIPFTGHTEFFAHVCNVPQTIMLFIIDHLKVALATTHIPLAAVSKKITKKHLYDLLTLMHDELQKKFHLSAPCILVTGINPHAGENGYLGREEIDVINPVIAELAAEGKNIQGPFPADTIFTSSQMKNADAVLTMYHDQALPIVKYLGFNKAVNLTLGLPFIRTSVDHGTALDLAGTKHVDPGSLFEAIKLAFQLACQNSHG